MCRSKIFLTFEIHYKIFESIYLKLGKRKKEKLKNSIFDDPLIANQIFSQISFVINKTDFAYIKHFH